MLKENKEGSPEEINEANVDWSFIFILLGKNTTPLRSSIIIITIRIIILKNDNNNNNIQLCFPDDQLNQVCTAHRY